VHLKTSVRKTLLQVREKSLLFYFVCQELKISAGMSRLLPLSVSSSAF